MERLHSINYGIPFARFQSKACIIQCLIDLLIWNTVLSGNILEPFRKSKTHSFFKGCRRRIRGHIICHCILNGEKALLVIYSFAVDFVPASPATSNFVFNKQYQALFSVFCFIANI